MTVQMVEYLGATGRVVLGEEFRSGDQQPWSAVAALQRMVIVKGPLQPCESVAPGLLAAFKYRQAGDGLHGRTVRLDRKHQTCADRHAVDHDRAGAADTVTAGHVDTASTGLLPKKIAEQVARANFRGNARAVNGHHDIDVPFIHAEWACNAIRRVARWLTTGATFSR